MSFPITSLHFARIFVLHICESPDLSSVLLARPVISFAYLRAVVVIRLTHVELLRMQLILSFKRLTDRSLTIFELSKLANAASCIIITSCAIALFCGLCF